MLLGPGQERGLVKGVDSVCIRMIKSLPPTYRGWIINSKCPYLISEEPLGRRHVIR